MRLIPRCSVLALALALAAAPGAAGAKPRAPKSPAPIAMRIGPPPGVYVYAATQHGAPLGTSRIDVHADEKGVRLNETATFGSVSAKTQATFDPGTLAQQSYESDVTSGGLAQHVDATALPEGAMRVHIAGQTVDVKALSGTQATYVGDKFVASLFLLPAMVKALGAGSMTDVTLSGGNAVRTTIEPGATDTSLTLSIDGVDVAFDFDPADNLVKSVTIPSSGTTITLQSAPRQH